MKCFDKLELQALSKRFLCPEMDLALSRIHLLCFSFDRKVELLFKATNEVHIFCISGSPVAHNRTGY